MDLLENTLFVKRSNIPAAGKGLFTKAAIAKGTRIIEYKGTITAWKDVDHKNGKNPYIYFVNRYHVIDASAHFNAMARYANDAKGLVVVKAFTNNCKYVKEGVRVFIEAIRDIPANGEILVGYGKEYWDTIRYNNSLHEK